MDYSHTAPATADVRLYVGISEFPQGLRGGPGVRVPMREIRSSNGESLRVYDTSGPQGHDVRSGLPRLREPWIAAPAPRASGEGHPAALRAQRDSHARDGVRRHPRGIRSGVRPRGSGARPRHHPRQRQSSRARADDHRPELRGQDQRQHRQFRRRRRRSTRRSKSCAGRRCGAPTP